jgi:formylglycine-generating enzyme required for sulfatase activity
VNIETWTNSAGAQENLPINCVNWYEAYAFCIWDGGFLPSETEWAYVAAGGSQLREYPWGEMAPGTMNQYAIYGDYYGGGDGYTASVTLIAPVGTPSLGASLWGQLDMVGDETVWALDWYAPYSNPCVDCAYLYSTNERVTRGAFFNTTDVALLDSTTRGHDTPVTRFDNIGFRCARTP